MLNELKKERPCLRRKGHARRRKEAYVFKMPSKIKHWAFEKAVDYLRYLKSVQKPSSVLLKWGFFCFSVNRLAIYFKGPYLVTVLHWIQK